MRRYYFECLEDYLQDPYATLKCDVTHETLKQGLYDADEPDSEGYVLWLNRDMREELQALLTEQRGQTTRQNTSFFDRDGDVPSVSAV